MDRLFKIVSAFEWCFYLFVACIQQLQTFCLVRNFGIPNLGFMSEVKACYPSTQRTEIDRTTLGQFFKQKVKPG